MSIVTAQHAMSAGPKSAAKGTASLTCVEGVFALDVTFDEGAAPAAQGQRPDPERACQGRSPNFDKKDIKGRLSYHTGSERVLELNTVSWGLKASEGKLEISFYSSKVSLNHDEHYQCHAQFTAKGLKTT